jgi:hypothetical protein
MNPNSFAKFTLEGRKTSFGGLRSHQQLYQQQTPEKNEDWEAQSKEATSYLEH